MATAQDAYEPDNTADNAKVITNGQTQNRSIHQAGNVDWAKFTIGASGATNVRIETSGASGDTEMWLYDPTRSPMQLAYDDDNGNGRFSLITLASLAAGTYYIKITEYGNNGTIAAYTLRASWTEGGGGQPDLTKESDNISRTLGAPGDTFTITQRVRNGGTAASGATKVYYYVNKDSRSTAAAAKVGERDLGALGAGSVSGEITFPWTAPANLPAGNYFIGYWIDGQQSVAESNENNNIWWWDNITIQGANWQSEAVNWRVNYENSWNKSGTITKPGASQIRVHFSQVRTESNYDHLRTETGNDWSGTFDNVTSGAKAGNTIQLTLTSDGSVTGYFIIDRIEWLGTSTGAATKAGELFGQVTTFSAGGTVSGATQSGVTMTFGRVSGSGAIPAAVQTGANGAWSQSGFASGTTYRATPSKTGYTFNPASRDFTSANNALNFTAATVPPPTGLAEALDKTDWTFTTGGSANWFGENTTYYNGGDAAQSGDIGNSQESWMQTTVTGPGTVSFWWKVSSEGNYDYLEFYIGTARQDRISGSVDWQQKSFSVPVGSQTLKWRFMKDGSVSSGSDCGWVDKVEWSAARVTFSAGGTVSGATQSGVTMT
ncbi:MAG TPA: CARDB domain-containing protein, partial [Verrucomicrobiota bacterium]|nr:CARDB domain-containing protein [Verrucomicrobiota bacterium]HOG88790.1 CARDB domain-containing protein [Verrucomicrobiota bacterium]HOR73139.1 CARDB domain-containing protein [Verrucomicrobiota bacterium]HOU89336.1 CARDB domain-containing protein [Verrucomicrobiota bacterium]HPK99641.1 CARDB domain-containing protein [Verrucomicrobiota bacterium]